jgi:hypothetical protein
VESFAGGWAWSVPLTLTRRQLTVMVDPGLGPVRGRTGLAESYRAALALTRHLAALTRGARPAGRPWARDASPYHSSRPAEPGLLLAGDAASFIDPLSSFGVKKAMASAWLAAVVVRSALDSPELASAALDLYARREAAVASALRAQAAAFAAAAAGAHPGDFWGRRAGAVLESPPGEPDTAVLRQDPEVLAAFADLRRREILDVEPGTGVRREPRAAIRGDRIALHDHLVAPAFPEGVRWLRGVDLLHLAERAPAVRHVPQLFEESQHLNPGVTLPDFLGALAVLVGRKILRFA